MGAGTKAPISRRALQNRVHLFVCYLCLVALGVVSGGAGQTAWPRLPCLVLTLMQFSQVDMYWSKKQQVHPYIARSLQIFVAKECLPGCINRCHLCHLCFRTVTQISVDWSAVWLPRLSLWGLMAGNTVESHLLRTAITYDIYDAVVTTSFEFLTLEGANSAFSRDVPVPS